MKFTEIQYQRPLISQIRNEYKNLLNHFQAAQTAGEQVEVIDKLSELSKDFGTNASVVSIRYTVNTEDPFYSKEQDYFDEIGPEYEELKTEYYNALASSHFKNDLIDKFGGQLFNIAETSSKTFRPEIIGDLQEENRLSSSYTKLVASAKIQYDGEEKNLSGLEPYGENPNRDIRKEVSDLRWNFFSQNNEEFNRIYSDMVQVRHKMARKLGYENYIPMGYTRLLRTDYNEDMVAGYREQILKHVVPVANKLRERQRQRTGLDKLMHYDLSFQFKTGNPKPQGSPEWIIDNGSKMYQELSPETHDFFEFMRRNELMDLVTKKGKAGGGYCSSLPKYKAPFIFSNFNGTSGDVDVLTHEAGHAFQVYSSMHHVVPEYYWPTYEACEIHSMSMEFFTWPWMHLFFEKDVEKYKFAHLQSGILFLPYGATVDEFQHEVYAKPDMNATERDHIWRSIEKKYLPYRNYEGNAFLENGGFWKKQAHIYNSPFYYIDYTLAQICAFQFWHRMQHDFEGAWKDYLRLCKAGGSMSFLELVKYANLESPFKEGVVEKYTAAVSDWLDKFDDEGL